MQMEKRPANGHFRNMNAPVIIVEKTDHHRSKGLLVIFHGWGYDGQNEFRGKLRPFG